MHSPAQTDTRADELLDWFAEHGRPWRWRASRDRWTVLVSEVCLQQTQVARAAPTVDRLLDTWPTPSALAQAPLSELLALWQGLGYPRRARNLWLASQVIAARGWPDDYTELPGVGPYTAAALRCFADGEDVLPPDINTRRVMARLFSDGPPASPDDPWSWGQAVMELGQVHCRARARCDECPLRATCPSRGTPDVVASPRQRPYEGSLRQRRGRLLRSVLADGEVDRDRDPEAADGLLADGLVDLRDDLLVPLEHT